MPVASFLEAAQAAGVGAWRVADRRSPGIPWATDVARELVDNAVSRGLLQRVPGRGVAITPAGSASPRARPGGR
jgi:hypothetical protein